MRWSQPGAIENQPSAEEHSELAPEVCGSVNLSKNAIVPPSQYSRNTDAIPICQKSSGQVLTFVFQRFSGLKRRRKFVCGNRRYCAAFLGALPVTAATFNLTHTVHHTTARPVTLGKDLMLFSDQTMDHLRGVLS